MEDGTGALGSLIGRLDASLRAFDWTRVEELCAEIVRAIRGSHQQPPDPALVRALSLLRRKRRFGCMARLAEAAIHVGAGTPGIAALYAQSLIDQGFLVAAERALRDALNTAAAPSDAFELQGLMGRVCKQWYVTAPSRAARQRETLADGIRWYLAAYEADRRANYWHGINVVALTRRAERDGVAIADAPAASTLAEEIVRLLAQGARKPDGQLPVWEIATLMEAYLALGRMDLMFERSREYCAHADADAFEVASTLRQLVEVWNLSDDDPPGSELLPLLRAKQLREEGGFLAFAPRELARERERTARPRLIHGTDGFQTLQWYRRGLDCCEAVARIETDSGRGIGTGWVLRAGDCLNGPGDELWLVTNAHVVSPPEAPCRGALLPSEAVAHFQLAGARVRLGHIVWSSPVDGFDCTLVRLRTPPAVKPLAVSSSPVVMGVPPPRMYMIGYPGGRDVQFSLHDNYLIAANDRLLHYRTPTEGGSSGSPVFNASWEVVGLHHAGSGTLNRIDGQEGTYEANEGIRLSALLEAARASGPKVGSLS